MDRRAAEPALLALLAVAAIAAAAATLPTVSETGTGGAGGGGLGARQGDGGILPTPNPELEPLIQLPDLSAVAGALAALLLLAALIYALAYRREFLRVVVGIAAVLALLALLFWLASLLDLGTAGRPSGDGWLIGAPAGAEGEPSIVSGPALLVVVLVVVMAGIVAMALASNRGFGEAGPDQPSEPTEEAAAVGEAAGRAADRIEATAALDNEVYTAWREMTGLLDVDRPETSTPGEFAAAAVDAGMAQDDVGALTRLFEDVRYGGQEPTADAESRAVAILRRIEATYAPPDEDEP